MFHGQHRHVRLESREFGRNRFSSDITNAAIWGAPSFASAFLQTAATRRRLRQRRHTKLAAIAMVMRPISTMPARIVRIMSPATSAKLNTSSRWVCQNGAVRRTRTGLRNRRSTLTQAASWRHSARAADRFSLKVSRRFR